MKSYVYQAVGEVARFRVTARIAIEPLLNFAPHKKKLSGCGLKIVDILFEFIFPNEVPDGTGCHLYTFAEFDCGEILFHYDAFL